MQDPTEADGHEARPRNPSGTTFVGLLVGAVLAAALIGQLTSPDPVPRTPGPVASTSPDLSATPPPDVPIGVESLKRCLVQMGGLVLSDRRHVPGSAVERWDCDAPRRGPWSVVIRASGGHFGVHSAVATFPVDLEVSGVPSTRPQDGVWNPGTQKLVWPLGSRHAQIVGDFGQATLEDLAARITVDRLDPDEGDKPQFRALNGFTVAATIPYGSPVVHEMRYGARDLGQASTLGDGLVFTGVTSGASFESQAFEAGAKPAGSVRGKPAIYSNALGGNGTLAWESAPGEVHYIGYSGSASSADAIEGLRALADKGRMLTPAQWENKDRYPVAAQSG